MLHDVAPTDRPSEQGDVGASTRDLTVHTTNPPNKDKRDNEIHRLAAAHRTKMGTAVLQSQSLTPKSTFLLLTKPPPSPTTNTQIFLHRRRPPLKISATNSSSSSSDTSSNDAPPPVQPPIRAPPETAEIRFRRGSRKRSRQLQQQDGGSAGIPKKAQAPPKDWEAMSLTEKAMELYVGEKGALFWLNKFAYASIFIMIGAWILFRFVGPSLNLYQLDAPPLSPSDVLKGS